MIHVLFLLMLYMGFGLIFNQLLWSKQLNNNWQKTIGESFFISVFFIVLINNLVQFFQLNIPQNIFFYLLLIVSLISLLYFLFINITKASFGISLESIFSRYKYHTIILIIIVIQLYYIIEQNNLLPLTSWDAWYAWIAKAKIWHYHGLNEGIVNHIDWFKSDANFTNPTSHYPDALPLIYVFNSGFYGWNEVRLNAIYPAMFIAFLLAFYGNIKLITNAKYALLAVFVIVTIPFVNVHVTLAGNADIWVSVYLVMCILNIHFFLLKPNITKFLLVLFFAISMLMFKLESWIWLSIIILSLVSSLMSYRHRKLLYFFITFAFLSWYLSGGFSLDLTYGKLVLTPDLIQIPSIGTFALRFENTTYAWLETLFLSKNWNLLWYTLPFIIILYTRISNKEVFLFPALSLTFSLFFLFILFYMSYASNFANDFTSINRIVLHIVPLYIYFAIMVVYEYPKKKLRVPSSFLY